MRAYRNISIRHKLQGMVLISCGVALLVSAAAFTLYDRTTFLRAKTDDLIASARVIGSNSTAALTFRDSQSAQDTMNALRARPHVIRACIYDAAGKVFAKYSRTPSEIGSCPPTAQREGSAVVAQRVILFQNISLQGESIGTIYIEADLKDLQDRLRRFMVIDALVLLGSLAVAFVLSFRLQRAISDPIRELAKTASEVSAQKDYSIRAIKRSQDEIGGLFDQFNSMLDRIQQRDVALQNAHDELEIRVEERTSFLNALIETSPLAILVLDSARKVQLCNPAFERLFQWTREEVIGKPAQELLFDGELLLQSTVISHGPLGGTLVNLDTQRRRKDGGMVDVEVHAVPLVVKGQVVGSLGIYQDISVRKRAEEAVHASELKYRRLFENSRDALLTVGPPSWMFTAGNPAAVNMFKMKGEEDFLSCGPWDLSPERQPDGRTSVDKAKDVIETTLREGFHSFEWMFRRLDGEEFPVDVLLTRLDDGGKASIQGTIRDITERKRAEEALRESEGRFRSLVETTSDWIWQADEEGRYTYSSPKVKDQLGYDPQEIIRRAPLDLVAPEERESLRELIKEIHAAPRPFSRERTYIAKDGHRVVLEINAVPIFDSDGHYRGARGIGRDITERKRAEAALRESEEQFRQLAENIHEVFFIFDAEPARTVYLSPAYEQIWGRSRQEVYERPEAWLDSVHPEDRERAADLFRQCLGGTPVEADVRLTRPDGSVRWIHTRSFPVSAPGGKSVRVVGISEDITEQRRVLDEIHAARAAAEAANRAKSEFLANMSHEIRTPMNGILGMTELALDTELTEEQRQYLVAVKSSGDSLLHVINDILDFSKVEAGKLDLELIEFDLHDCLAEAVKTLALRAHGKGLELAYQLGADVPPRVVGDPMRLRQILTNLLGNAVKFTPKGEVVLRVDVQLRDHKADLHFTVSDTGIGISKDKQKAIFEAFAQADASTTRVYGGTGLGLAISARLIEMMGGRISVASEEGKGSRFEFNVSVAIPPPAMLTAALPTPEILRGVPVLVVDDNQTNREILVHATRGWGMLPCAVDSGEAAVREMESALQQQKPYRVALIDAGMPVMDGFDLAERLRRDPRVSEAVIMMLTSSGQRGDAARCRELGISAYLVKPIRRDELMQALLAALGRSAVVRPLVTRHTLRESRAGLRILVAEDNAVNQLLIRRLLEKLGHAPELVGTGREAAAVAGSGRFDLVFMDVQMPDMDGFAATAAIRQREKTSGAHLPIFAMTAHAMKGDEERCLAAGMDGYISKPVNFSKVQEILDGVRAKQVHSPAWDKQLALSQIEGDETLLREIAEIFLRDCADVLADLHRSLEDRNFEKLGRIAHRLKGGMGCLRAQPALSAAIRLEETASRQDFAPTTEAVHQLQRELVGLQKELEAFCEVAHESIGR